MAWSKTYPQEKKREVWRVASRRYRAAHPGRASASVRRYEKRFPERRAKTLYAWRSRNSLKWDASQVRHEMGKRLKMPATDIPSPIIERRAVLRTVKRAIRGGKK